MIISDLSYLEFVSEVPSIVGGQNNKDKIKEEKIIKKNKFQLESDSITIVVEQGVKVVTSEDQVEVVLFSTYAL